MVNGDRILHGAGGPRIDSKWTWHDHANDTDAPMIWLDGLDTPLVRMLEAGFYEQYDEETQPVGAGIDPSSAKYGAGAAAGVGTGAGRTYSPLWHYPLSQARVALERLAAEETGSPFDGVILEYTNPLTGGPAMPTIACYIQMLRPGEHTQAHRHVCCTNYHVIEGSGYSLVGGRQLDWEERRLHSADVDLPRARQHRQPPCLPVQLHRRAGDEGGSLPMRRRRANGRQGDEKRQWCYLGSPHRWRARGNPRLDLRAAVTLRLLFGPQGLQDTAWRHGQLIEPHPRAR